MLKTRITEQYGLKVPFINAGMAFIATAPLVRAVCSAGGMGMLGSAAMPPDALQAAIRDIKSVNPVCYGVTIIARFSGIEHIEVCVAERDFILLPPGRAQEQRGQEYDWVACGLLHQTVAAAGHASIVLGTALPRQPPQPRPVAQRGRQITPRAAGSVLWIARGRSGENKTKRLHLRPKFQHIKRRHLRPLGVSQNESVHSKLESQSSTDENLEGSVRSRSAV